VRGPLVAEAEQEAKVGAGERSLIGPFKAMWWGPIQFFNWWSLLIGGLRAGLGSGSVTHYPGLL
jgi:hypothetical protein